MAKIKQIKVPTGQVYDLYDASATHPEDLATVATSGDYDDLLNKPTIPTNADYVDLTTDQNINGTKIFEKRPQLVIESLPSGYIPLEYIQTASNAYINTNHNYSTNEEIVLTFQQNTSSTYRIWGAFNQQSYVGQNISLTYISSWGVRYETANNSQRAVNLTAINTNKHTLNIKSDGTIYFDNVSYGKSPGYAANFTLSYPAFLGTINPGGTTPTANLNGKIYKYEVLNSNGTHIQNMYPAKRVSDSAIGMYDIVSNTFYVSISGTAFTAGPAASGEFLLDSDLKSVAFSGSYNDLTNKPTIPSTLASLSSDSTHRVVTDAQINTWNNKQAALTFDLVPIQNSLNPVISGGIYNSVENLREVAEGKTNTFVVDATVDTIFNSQANEITLDTSIADLNKGIINLDSMKVGDNFYVIQTDVPDRWLKSQTYAGVTKGDILTLNLDGTNRSYRVLKHVAGSVFEIMGLFTVGGAQAFGSNETYENSSIDTYLNTMWYLNLDNTARSAIRSKTIRQDSWYQNTTGNPHYELKYATDNAYKLSLGNVAFGSTITRNIYLLSIQDIIDYLEATPSMTQTNTTLTNENILTLFFNNSSSQAIDLWLRSAAASSTDYTFALSGDTGRINTSNCYNSKHIYPTLQIDLSVYGYNSYVSSVQLGILETAKVPVTDVQVNNTSVVNNNIANIDLSGYAQSSALATVATTGSYSDLSNTPTIPDITNKIDKINSSTDNAIVRFDGISSAIQNSLTTINDMGSITIGGNWTATSSQNPYLAMGSYAKLTANTAGAFTFAPGNTPTFLATTSEFRPMSGTANQVNVGSALYPFKIGFFGTNIQVPQLYLTGNIIKRIASLADNPTVSYSYTLPNQTGTIALVADIPSSTNDLINNSGFITKEVNNLTNYTLSANLSSVAISGNYSDLINKPSIPSATADITNNSGFITKDVNNLVNYTLSTDLAAVAASGLYSDLSGVPTIPDELADLQADASHRTVTDTEKSTWNNKQDALTFDTIPTDSSTNPVTSDGIYSALEDIREIAEGKKQTYVINTTLNPVFASQTSGIIGMSPLITITTETVPISALSIGDTIYVVDLDYPDRWVSSVTSAGNAAVFNILETAKVPVTDVKVGGSSVVTNNVANITIPVTDVQVNGDSVVTNHVAMVTDSKVAQNEKSDNQNYKLLFTNSSSITSGAKNEVGYDTNITVNPQTDTITAATFNGNATALNGLQLLDQSYAYKGKLSISIECVNAILKTGLTENEIFALEGNRYGQLYLASDTNKYWRRKNTQTAASSSNWRNDTTAVTTSLSAPLQLTTEDYIYIRINTQQSYYAQLPKFFVTASYDNINGSTSVVGFCRQQNQYYFISCSYNGNNLLGVYQPTGNTNIYYFKFAKYRSGYGGAATYNANINIYYNFSADNPTIEFIDKNHADYNTVKAYSYISSPTVGIKFNTPIDGGSYNVLTQAIADTGTETTGKFISAKVLKQTITNAVNALDVTNITGFGANKTLSTLTQTNGKISATFQDIAITKSQISDFPAIPTKVSDLTNDSNFITANDLPLIFEDYSIPLG